MSIITLLIQHIDWVAGIFGLTGMYLLSHKNRWGWIGLFICSLGFIIIGIENNLYGLITSSIIYGLIEIRGFVKHHE